MASRCINALNELDVISDKIFYKYSKNRLKQDIANKVRDSKSRAERNASPADFRQGKCTPRKSNCSNRSSSISTAATTSTKNSSSLKRTKSCGAKSNTDIKTSKKHHQDPRKSKSSSYKKPIRTFSEATTSEQVHNTEDIRNFTPSIFGKFNPSAPTHKTGKWFNFKDGVDQGVIDSFECDKLKEKALCYKVDAKESKAVPKLLRHRLEVRIGRNGDVRNEDAGMKPGNQESDGIQDGSIRSAPLSWEEQLNWKNTQIIEPKGSQSTKTKDEGLCETHPVIFHPEANHERLSNTTNISNKASASYRLYMDKKLVSDRRNLTCGLKCVTSVQIEEGSNDVHKDGSNPIKRTKSHDSDMMDMTNTIKNIEKIYRTSSQESERKVPYVKTLENDQGTKDGVEIVNHHEEKDSGILEEEKTKINKRVSFKDDLEGAAVLDINSAHKGDDFNMETGDAVANQNTKRPSSSRSRSNLDRKQEFKTKKSKRPYTAPHCSPRTPHDINIFEQMDKSSHVKHLRPILVPTSNDNEVVSENELVEPKKETPEPSEKIHDIRVTFGCKSAPTERTVKHTQESIKRSLSTTSARVKTEKYERPQPTAVLDTSDPMELPPNVPPGQALIELRKKIRENLAKETADLQLDIQQLYIKHHSYRN